MSDHTLMLVYSLSVMVISIWIAAGCFYFATGRTVRRAWLDVLGMVCLLPAVVVFVGITTTLM